MALVTLNPTVDGFGIRAGINEPIATILAGAGTNSATTGQPIRFTTSNDASGVNYAENRRGVFLFDSSGLGPSAKISSAVFSIYVTAKQDQLTQSIGVTNNVRAGSGAIGNSDYNIANFESARFATDKTIASLSTGAYADYTLNASGIAVISLQGITKLGLRVSADIDETAPGWINNQTSNIDIQFSGDANPPKLAITFTLSSGFLALL